MEQGTNDGSWDMGTEFMTVYTSICIWSDYYSANEEDTEFMRRKFVEEYKKG